MFTTSAALLFHCQKYAECELNIYNACHIDIIILNIYRYREYRFTDKYPTFALQVDLIDIYFLTYNMLYMCTYVQ